MVTLFPLDTEFIPAQDQTLNHSIYLDSTNSYRMTFHLNCAVTTCYQAAHAEKVSWYFL